MKNAYPVILTKGKNKYVVYIPDFDINTEGNTIADALFMASDAIGLMGITYEDEGKEIPKSSDVLPAVQEGSIAQFVVVDLDSYRKANDTRAVRKNVTIPYYLNQMAEKAGLSFSQVLQDGLKKKLGYDL